MDQSLDEILADRQRRNGGSRGPRGGARRRERRDDYPRDGVRKSFREDSRKLDDEWVHDRFEEDNGGRRSRNPRGRRESPDKSYETQGTKIRVDNIHYELTPDDLRELFARIGTVTSLELLYDRAGRSEGTAYVVYSSYADAREAVKQFDGANAKAQPIKLTIMPSGPGPRGNPFDNAVKPGSGRSLADRITRPGRRSRSLSPGRDLDEEAVRKGIDRYVPGRSGSRSRSPLPRGRRDGGGGGGGGRRPGERRGRGDQGGRARGGAGGTGGTGGTGGNTRGGRDGRPKKTQEELDAEMADYFGSGSGSGNAAGASAANGQSETAAVNDDDIDMIE